MSACIIGAAFAYLPLRTWIVRSMESYGRWFRVLWELNGVESRVQFLETELQRISNKFSELNEELNSIKSRYNGVQEKLNQAVLAQTRVRWWMEIQPGEETRLPTLGQIAKMVACFRNGLEPGDVTDSDLGVLLGRLGAAIHCASDEPEVRELVLQIRSDGFLLKDRDFPAIKAALRHSAEEMLRDSADKDQAKLRRARGYAEIMRYADQWNLEQLDSLKVNLDAVRHELLGTDGGNLRTRAHVEEVHGFGSGFGGHQEKGRLWKRVWPEGARQWGQIRFLDQQKGTICEHACVLSEISLRGASCRICALERIPGPSVVKLELQLPEVGVAVRVEKARIKIHPGQFSDNGRRDEPGFSFEFMEMSSDELARLGRFISGRPELDRRNPPACAPWLDSNSGYAGKASKSIS